MLVRELDERLGFGELIQQHLTDSRRDKEQVVSFRRLAAAIGLQPPGGLRRPQRRGATFPGPDFSADRFGQDLGSRGGVNVALAELRNRDVRLGELCRTSTTQPGTDWESGSHGLGLPDDPGQGFHRGPGVQRAGAECIQRVLRVQLFSPPAAVQ
jgi:hypothetical protein